MPPVLFRFTVSGSLMFKFAGFFWVFDFPVQILPSLCISTLSLVFASAQLGKAMCDRYDSDPSHPSRQASRSLQ